MEQVVRCCVENAASVAKTFITSDVVIVDANEDLPRPYRTPMPTSNFIPAPNSNFKPRSGGLFFTKLSYYSYQSILKLIYITKRMLNEINRIMISTASSDVFHIMYGN